MTALAVARVRHAGGFVRTEVEQRAALCGTAVEHSDNHVQPSEDLLPSPIPFGRVPSKSSLHVDISVRCLAIPALLDGKIVDHASVTAALPAMRIASRKSHSLATNPCSTTTPLSTDMLTCSS